MNRVARQSGVRWLLLGCVVGLAGCGGGGGNGGGGGGPFPALSPPESSEPGANGLVTQLRPQLARVSDEPLRVVLHWETKDGPLTLRNPTPASWFDTCNTLTFHVTTPDGQKLELQPEPQQNKVRHPADLSSTPTLFFILGATGVQVTLPGTYEAGWKGGRVAALEAAGQYQVSVSGKIMPGQTEEKGKEPIPFASPPVRVERGVGGHLPQSEIVAVARKKLGSKLKAGRVEPGVVYDDADGNRLVHFTGPSSQQWHDVIYTVQVSPQGKVLNVFSKEVSNCVAEGTSLDGEAGPVAVERVRPGDRLWGYDLGRGERVLTTVRDVRRGEAGETLLLGCGLRVTGNHPVRASGEWKLAGDLAETDELLRADGGRTQVGRIDRVRGRVAVFDVTVDEPHNFFASNVLVHNKDRAIRPALDDLWYLLWSPQGLDK